MTVISFHMGSSVSKQKIYIYRYVYAYIYINIYIILGTSRIFQNLLYYDISLIFSDYRPLGDATFELVLDNELIFMSPPSPVTPLQASGLEASLQSSLGPLQMTLSPQLGPSWHSTPTSPATPAPLNVSPATPAPVHGSPDTPVPVHASPATPVTLYGSTNTLPPPATSPGSPASPPPAHGSPATPPHRRDHPTPSLQLPHNLDSPPAPRRWMNRPTAGDRLGVPHRRRPHHLDRTKM